jgi:plasmid stabilization system protein ParE
LEKSPGINVDVGSGGRPGREPSFDEFEGRGATMPQQRWTATRERQYDHIKEGLLERGNSEDLAEEIAARTVNKERARAGEARRPSRSSITDISSGRRGGGLRSHWGPGGRTREQLYQQARRRGVKGRSTMSKAQLQQAVDK